MPDVLDDPEVPDLLDPPTFLLPYVLGPADETLPLVPPPPNSLLPDDADPADVTLRFVPDIPSFKLPDDPPPNDLDPPIGWLPFFLDPLDVSLPVLSEPTLGLLSDILDVPNDFDPPEGCL
jgi:hypothetical protein